eukprot:3657345-Rhodomonas_salina.5
MPVSDSSPQHPEFAHEREGPPRSFDAPCTRHSFPGAFEAVREVVISRGERVREERERGAQWSAMSQVYGWQKLLSMVAYNSQQFCF